MHDIYLVSLLLLRDQSIFPLLNSYFKPGTCLPVAGEPAFLELLLSVNICMLVCVCSPPRLLTTSGVIWCDIDPIRLVE